MVYACAWAAAALVCAIPLALVEYAAIAGQSTDWLARLVRSGLLLLCTALLIIAVVIFTISSVRALRSLRELAFSRFALALGLEYRRARTLEARGLLFGEQPRRPDAVHRRPHPLSREARYRARSVGRGLGNHGRESPRDQGESQESLFVGRHALSRPNEQSGAERGTGRLTARPAQPAIEVGLAHDRRLEGVPRPPVKRFRYLVMTLPRKLPHLVIDAHANGRLRSGLRGEQQLSLEGDFDRFFQVYAPAGHERDALELLTPDVMAGLIDYGRDWDIEVVGNRLVVASHRAGRAADRDDTTALLHFSETVAETVLRQAGYYSDPRLRHAPQGLSRSARRLRRRSRAKRVGIEKRILIAYWSFFGLVIVAGLLGQVLR